MEVSALTHHSSMPGLRGPSALLRLQSDERLISLTRRGNHAAFEVLCARYQSRLLAFCRHMLNSREDAEDVLQEVFAAAFNAVLADEREINVRPWLYRIARNRSLNHLRRVAAIGVDSMDVHFADGGLTTTDKVLRRESFRELIADVHELPETQRTALLLREIDALSYEQIAHAMENTVPSVKSLLVRARIGLAEAAEARQLSCEQVRFELGEVAEGLGKLGTPARRHVRGCDRCRDFRAHLKHNNRALAAIFPVVPLLLVKRLLLTKLGSTASAGGAHVAGGAGASVGAGAGATAGAGAAAGGGAGLAGGMMTAGAGALATKAVASLAAAAIVTAGAVAADHAVAPRQGGPAVPTSHTYAGTSAAQHSATPQVIHQRPQPISAGATRARAHRRARPPALPVGTTATTGSNTSAAEAGTIAAAELAGGTSAAVTSTTTPVSPAAGATGPKQPEGATEVTTETTELPSAATAPPQSTPGATAESPVPGGEAAGGQSPPAVDVAPVAQTGGTAAGPSPGGSSGAGAGASR